MNLVFAQIYKTEHEGALAFLVVVDKSESRECRKDSVESRLSRIESQIGELLNVIKSDTPRLTGEIGKDDGLVVIRTRDLRRVKATS